MYKLLSIDLDGTLLNSAKRISDENKEAVKAAIGRGIKVVVCSGRVFKGAGVYARELGIKGPLISCNGAVIKNIENDEIYYSNLLSKEDCCNIIDFCHKENVYFHAYIDNDVYTEYSDCPSASYWRSNSALPQEDRVKVCLTDDLKKVVNESIVLVTKIVIISKDFGILKKVRDQIGVIPGVDVMSSNYDNLEVVNKGVNKGAALKYVAEKLNIKRDEIIAIGDNENDYAMLKYAGYSVAMGNAQDSIKQIAHHITSTNNENGVAKAIKRILL